MAARKVPASAAAAALVDANGTSAESDDDAGQDAASASGGLNLESATAASRRCRRFPTARTGTVHRGRTDHRSGAVRGLLCASCNRLETDYFRRLRMCVNPPPHCFEDYWRFPPALRFRWIMSSPDSFRHKVKHI
ncbi:endonuclease domain-containing protein [Streptomyces sp. 7N604]|uniref:endonuclease domain-containing protein n=1 Tax=Streptomyces sp. 7N604 TaxID=3457415 RepID=UPI003FCEFF69